MGSSRHTTQGWGVSAYPTAIHAINVPGTSNDTRTGVEALAKRFDAGRAMEIPSSITPLSRMGFSTYQPSATLERRGHSSFPSPDSDAPAGSHTCPDGYEWYSCTEDTLFIFKGCCRIDPCKMVGYCPKWAFAVAAGEPDEYQALTAVSSYEGWTEILLQSTHDGKAEQFTIRASTRHGEASLTTSTRSESSTTSTRSLFSGTSMTSMTGSAYGNPPTATDADTGYEGVPISTGEPESAQHNKLSGGAIAGIVIGVVAGVAIMAGALLFWWWKRRRNQGNMSGPVPPVADYKGMLIHVNYLISFSQLISCFASRYRSWISRNDECC